MVLAAAQRTNTNILFLWWYAAQCDNVIFPNVGNISQVSVVKHFSPFLFGQISTEF